MASQLNALAGDVNLARDLVAATHGNARTILARGAF
jgi:hypothetical protein